MNSKTTKPSALTRPVLIDELAQFVIASLPDSISHRRRLLEALLVVLPQRDETRLQAARMLWNLEQHEKLQQELSL